jgi:hypothetical protein
MLIISFSLFIGDLRGRLLGGRFGGTKFLQEPIFDGWLAAEPPASRQKADFGKVSLSDPTNASGT